MGARPQRETTEIYDEMLDEMIVEAAREGDDAAQEYLINKYKNFVRAKARSYFLIGADRAASADPHNFTLRYLHAAAAAVDWAWELGALIDRELEVLPKIVQRIVDEPEVHRRYVEAWHLLEPASTVGSVMGG